MTVLIFLVLEGYVYHFKIKWCLTKRNTNVTIIIKLKFRVSWASLWLSLQRIHLQCWKPGFEPGLGRSPWEGEGYQFQYSGLENSMDYIVHGITKSQIWLNDFHFYLGLVIETMWLVDVKATRKMDIYWRMGALKLAVKVTAKLSREKKQNTEEW